MEQFANIDTWVFDLDNTLYPRHCDLFSQIDVAMTAYLSVETGLDRTEARVLQKQLYRDFGTTLNGMMQTRGIDPHAFLEAVHDIDYSPLPKSHSLAEKLLELPGRRVIYTNGSTGHVENTLKAMEIDVSIFDGVFDIVASDFVPKPMTSAFDQFLQLHEIDPKTSAMFEDLPRNLEPAKTSGMLTVLVEPMAENKAHIDEWEKADGDHPHIDFKTDDLESFLDGIVSSL